MDIHKGQEILFSNFSYDPQIYYFIYCGDVKAYYLNTFVRRVLQKKAGQREVCFIAVIPDIFTQYDFENIIVINPSIQENCIDHSLDCCCRIPGSEFMQAVSKSPAIRKLIHAILKNQEELYISLFESIKEMCLDEIERVSILGPDKNLAEKWNNKIFQYQQIMGLMPMAEHYFCDESSSLCAMTNDLHNRWQDGIFISCSYSAAGANSLISKSKEETENWGRKKNGPFLVARFIPHTLDPTVLAVVANEDDVYIAGVADQVIQDGNRFVGSIYPSQASPEQKKLLLQYTVEIGKLLGKHGYRGIFGCDYIIADDGTIYFIEINARKQGTTLEFCYTLEQALPDGAPMLPELEYYAVTENAFPENCVEPSLHYDEICWGTHNYKLQKEMQTTGYIPHNPYARQSFEKVTHGRLRSDFVILEHVGAGLKVMPGTFLARVVAIAKKREDVASGLRQGVGFIEQTITEA